MIQGGSSAIRLSLHAPYFDTLLSRQESFVRRDQEQCDNKETSWLSATEGMRYLVKTERKRGLHASRCDVLLAGFAQLVEHHVGPDVTSRDRLAVQAVGLMGSVALQDPAKLVNREAGSGCLVRRARRRGSMSGLARQGTHDVVHLVDAGVGEVGDVGPGRVAPDGGGLVLQCGSHM